MARSWPPRRRRQARRRSGSGNRAWSRRHDPPSPRGAPHRPSRTSSHPAADRRDLRRSAGDCGRRCPGRPPAQAIPLKKPNYATDCRIKRHQTCRNARSYNAARRRRRLPGINDLRLALFEPDIPQNTGALLRLAACFGVAVDLIEPLGFLLDDRRLKRAALDYLDRLTIRRHASWDAFVAERDAASRLVLLTTRGEVSFHRFAFAADDTLLLGRESAGVPVMSIAPPRPAW